MLLLGPVVGHTTFSSARVWIRARRPASEYMLRVQGSGMFPFVPTGANADLYGTAIATAHGLRPDWRYRYQVLHRGRVLGQGRGRFRTMPPLGSWLPQIVVVASCSKNDKLGVWTDLARFVRDVEPHALFFIGDQVYHDQGRPGTDSVWKDYLDGRLGSPDKLRKALADTYQHCWSRPEVAEVLRNCPSYMMWDDHDIRDGWGSWASDSPTIAARSPKAAKVCAVDEAYFQAARDVAWHFQLCRNPLTYPRAAADGQDVTATEMVVPGSFGTRTSFGFAIEVGRVAYVIIDSRGNRDLWRDGPKVLGAAQWAALEGYVDHLSWEVDAVVFFTPVPIVSMGPDSIAQSLFQGWQDDVKLVKAGNQQALRRFQLEETSGGTLTAALGIALPLSLVPRPFMTAVRARNLAGQLTKVKHSELDDVRDQWSNEHSRPEQERLIRLAARARTSNRPGAIPRSVMFAAGDLHVGARFTLDVDGSKIPCLISSGLSQEIDPHKVALTVDDAFEVTRGIRAMRQGAVNVPNFGVVSIDLAVQPTQLSLSVIQQSGREASALRFGGYVLTGDPVPASTRRIVQKVKDWADVGLFWP